MARKKVNLQWISNNNNRRMTYKRRCNGLVKKVSEITTLGGINACVIVYGERNAQPEVWPSDAEAKQLLKKFMCMPDLGKLKKTQSQEEFIHSRAFRLREQVSKLEDENRELDTSILLHNCMNRSCPSLISTTKHELISLREMVEMKTSKAKARLQQLVEQQGALQEPLHVLLPSSSSSQTQVSSYMNTDMQRKAPLVEYPRLQQQDWQLAGLAHNHGEPCALIGSSSDHSMIGCDVMRTYNLGS